MLTRQERHLSIRAFTDKMKRGALQRQKGKCKFCKKQFLLEEMEAIDHITPWHEERQNHCGKLSDVANKITAQVKNKNL
ncbi:MAG: hypothetical protein U0517_02575 [Candidatus Andersenbacteria bacterium]